MVSFASNLLYGPMSRSRWNRWSFVLAGILLVSGCTTLPKGDPDVDTHRKELGLASWYGPNFHGRVTANGERYAMGELTAAHRTLPFGTILLVTNLENSRQVRVRINDRGPYARGRILDLSHAAAQELEMVRQGTSRIVFTTTHTRNGTPTKVATGQSILPMVP